MSLFFPEGVDIEAADKREEETLVMLQMLEETRAMLPMLEETRAMLPMLEEMPVMLPTPEETLVETRKRHLVRQSLRSL